MNIVTLFYQPNVQRQIIKSKTNKRGEQNQIKVNNNSKYPDEVWLALYIQACITYQTLDKQ